MRAIALRGIAERKLRSFAVAFAIFLGVALTAGTFILTDTIGKSFDDIFKSAYATTDVVVSPKEVVKDEASSPPPFSDALLAKARAVDGVDKAAGSVGADVRLVDSRNAELGAGFAPNFVFSNAPQPFETVTYKAGRAPRGTNEVAIDKSTADRKQLKLGDRIGVAGQRKVSRYRIVGINQLGDTTSGGSVSATLPLAEAQRVTGREGRFDELSVDAAPGVSPAQLRDRVRQAMPSTVRVETGAQAADRQSSEISDQLSFLPIALLVFAGVVLVVAAFLIFNTFSITVAQRIREFGLLRTLGASRRQVLTAVISEAAVVGVLASLVGLAGGFGVAAGLKALFNAIGITLPAAGQVFETRTIVVSLLLGIGVSLVAASVPALRATRVTPMAALLEAELPESRRSGRLVALSAFLLGLFGLGLLLFGLFGKLDSSGNAAAATGGGAAAVLLAVSLYSARLVKPLAALIGRPLQLLPGIAGRLARENAIRKPGRTAVTAAALMIGVALVTFVTVFVAGLNRSSDSAIDRSFESDLIVQGSGGFTPLGEGATEEVAKVDGIAKASPLGTAAAKVVGVKGTSRAGTVDPRSVTDAVKISWKRGSDATARNLTDSQVVVDADWAKSNKIGVGDTMRIVTPANRRAALKVVGSVDDKAGILGDWVITRSAQARYFDERRVGFVLATLADGADPATVERRVKTLLKRDYPAAKVLNQAELKDQQSSQLQPLVNGVYGLLSLAIIVSLFGIVNTLALSIHERTRELGMLRAVGMSRRQVRRVVRYESVITAMIGAVLGLVLGVSAALLISRPLADEGFELSFPIVQLVVLLVLAALAGVLAGIGPARRAAKLDVLKALSYE